MNNLSEIIKNNVDTIAFIIGNGINYQYKSAIPWKDLLKDLWVQYAKDGNTDFIDDGDLTYTEIYDLIELKYNKWRKQQERPNKIPNTYINSLNDNLKEVQFPKPNTTKETQNCHVTISSKAIELENKLQKELTESTKKVINSFGLFPKDYDSFDKSAIAIDLATRGRLHQLLMIKHEINKKFASATLDNQALTFLQFALNRNIPILTTNYDLGMANLLKLNIYQMSQSDSNQYLYPVATYFSNKPLEAAIEGFGIWHINGMVGYQNSIRLGLCDYMDLVQYLRELMCIDKE
ncbi:MAG: hypothetical protein J6X31_07180, partial [Bacteroidales bacterium]|nr:hypothetical protein [Bacteroidales bacterium]